MLEDLGEPQCSFHSTSEETTQRAYLVRVVTGEVWHEMNSLLNSFLRTCRNTCRNQKYDVTTIISDNVSPLELTTFFFSHQKKLHHGGLDMIKLAVSLGSPKLNSGHVLPMWPPTNRAGLQKPQGWYWLSHVSSSSCPTNFHLDAISPPPQLLAASCLWPYIRTFVLNIWPSQSVLSFRCVLYLDILGLTVAYLVSLWSLL